MDEPKLNRAQRRALKHQRRGAAKRFKYVHEAILTADFMPRVEDDADRIVQQKILLLDGLAKLKAGTFDYKNATTFHDFISLALRAARLSIGGALVEPANALGEAFTQVLERWQEIHRFAATGDELRALEMWLEAVCEAMGELPVGVLKSLHAEHAQEELALRAEMAAKGGKS